MDPSRLIILGGFLGAGKTTLVSQAAERLHARGMRVGLVTNDQADDLVDTAVLGSTGAPVCEVSGGCFCCRFEDLVSALDRLIARERPDVLIGEPVGSCTDLSATVLQPLKDLHRDRFRVAPFTVLVDVKQVRVLEQLRASLAQPGVSRFSKDVLYIYRKQLEEADVIVLNKADLVPSAELTEVEGLLRREFPEIPVITISAITGEGVDSWLDVVLADQAAGHTIAEVDYDQYAAGEAALGWLNASVRLNADAEIDWKEYCLELLGGLQQDFQAMSADIAHLKVHLTAGTGLVTANLTNNHDTPSIRGSADDPSLQAALLINVRAHIAPEPLQAMVERQLQRAGNGKVNTVLERLESLAPARPQPTHRYGKIV